MIPIDESTTIRRSVHDVFAYVTDFTRWPEWRRSLNKATTATEDATGVGTNVAVEGQMMGRDLAMVVEITSYVENERIGFRTSAGPIGLEGEFRFDAVPDGTRLAVTGQAEPAGVFKMLGPLIERQVHQMWSQDLAALKGVLEG